MISKGIKWMFNSSSPFYVKPRLDKDFLQSILDGSALLMVEDQSLGLGSSNGAFVMIDDFTSIDKNGNYIAKCFFEVFKDRDILFFDTYSNGQTYRIFNN